MQWVMSIFQDTCVLRICELISPKYDLAALRPLFSWLVHVIFFLNISAGGFMVNRSLTQSILRTTMCSCSIRYLCKYFALVTGERVYSVQTV